MKFKGDDICHDFIDGKEGEFNAKAIKDFEKYFNKVTFDDENC